MISIIYPFKNREKQRVLNSIDSILNQNNNNFNIIFIDYGSDEPLNLDINSSKFTYVYLDVKNQPWNKSKAINHALKYYVDMPYCFIADVDMLFKPNFIDTALELTTKHNFFYFQVAYLKQHLVNEKDFFDTNNFKNISNYEATGMTVFKTDILKSIQGFDEFFHFWGAEDTDVHNRITNLGHKVHFYNENVLMAHQWHPSYIISQSNKLTQKIQLSNIIEINHLHLKYNLINKITKVNDVNWGEIQSNNLLKNIKVNNLPSYKSDVLYWINQIINNLQSGDETALKFILPADVFTLKYKIKKLLGKKVRDYYTLKQVNDIILLQVISRLHNHIYSYRIDDNLQAIYFNIRKN